MPFLPFVYGYPSSSPRAHYILNKSVPTLRYTRRHGSTYTGPCPKALTECSSLDFRRSSIASSTECSVNADVALNYAARETCLARAKRKSSGSHTTGTRYIATVVMVVHAGKKPTTKKIYFSQAPVRASFCNLIFFDSPDSFDRTGRSCFSCASVLFISLVISAEFC